MSFDNEKKRQGRQGRQGRSVNKKTSSASKQGIHQFYQDNRPETQNMAQLYAAIQRQTINKLQEASKNNKPVQKANNNQTVQRQVWEWTYKGWNLVDGRQRDAVEPLFNPGKSFINKFYNDETNQWINAQEDNLEEFTGEMDAKFYTDHAMKKTLIESSRGHERKRKKDRREEKNEQRVLEAARAQANGRAERIRNSTTIINIPAFLDYITIGLKKLHKGDNSMVSIARGGNHRFAANYITTAAFDVYHSTRGGDGVFSEPERIQVRIRFALANNKVHHYDGHLE